MPITRADFDRRLSRLERIHAHFRAGEQKRLEMDTSVESTREVLQILWDVGAFHPTFDNTGHWRELREKLKAELSLTDDDFLPLPYDSQEYWGAERSKTQQQHNDEPQQSEPIQRVVPT
jgi:hypothetical protein